MGETTNGDWKRIPKHFVSEISKPKKRGPGTAGGPVKGCICYYAELCSVTENPQPTCGTRSALRHMFSEGRVSSGRPPSETLSSATGMFLACLREVIRGRSEAAVLPLTVITWKLHRMIEFKEASSND